MKQPITLLVTPELKTEEVEDFYLRDVLITSTEPDAMRKFTT